VLDRCRRFLAGNEILYLDDALLAFLRSLDDHRGRVAPVGIGHLLAEVLRGAEIHFGSDAGLTQAADDLLVASGLVTVEHQHHDRPDRRLGSQIAGQLERVGEARDADGKTGRGDGLGAESRHQAVVAPTTTDRAEYDLLALLVGDGEGQLNLEDRAGVVFEPSNHRRIDPDAVRAIARCPEQRLHRPQLGDARQAPLVAVDEFGETDKHALAFGFFGGPNIEQYALDLIRLQAGALSVVTTLVFAPRTEQGCDALRAQPVEFVDGAQN